MINLEKQAREMFSDLKKHIGEEVVINYWHYGVLCKEKAIIRSVEDFERISVDGMSIPFVGKGVAIVSITTGSEILYLQPFVYPYDVRDNLKVIEMKRKAFGDRIADECLEEYKLMLKEMQELKKQEEKEIADFNTTKVQGIIDATLPYVIEESKEGFISMVKNNSESAYGIAYVKMTSELLIAIGNGMDFEEAIRTIADEKHGATGYMMGCAANVIVHCSARGEEFRKYWNRINGLSDDQPGVVNPAILTIEKK